MTYFGLFQQASDTNRPTTSSPPPYPHQKKLKIKTGEKQTSGEKPFVPSTDLKLKTAGNILHGANEKKIV